MIKITIVFGILFLCWYIASFFYKNDFQEEILEDTPERAYKGERHPLEGKPLPTPDHTQKVIDQSVPCSGAYFFIGSSYEQI